MPPKPLALYRRRWTLVFSVPFALLMVAAFGYSLLLLAMDDKLLKLIGGIGAFAAFCIAGTFGKTVVDALINLKAAVVIDSACLDDRRGSTGLVRWEDIESVELDPGEQQQILVKVIAQAVPGRSKLASKTHRIFFGADYTISLDGLHYHHQRLARLLAQYHRQANAAPAAPTAKPAPQ